MVDPRGELYDQFQCFLQFYCRLIVIRQCLLPALFLFFVPVGLRFINISNSSLLIESFNNRSHLSSLQLVINTLWHTTSYVLIR